jgi:hypothetical protein
LTAGVILVIVILVLFMPVTERPDDANWIKVVISDTMHVPVQQVLELGGSVKLEAIAANRQMRIYRGC